MTSKTRYSLTAAAGLLLACRANVGPETGDRNQLAVEWKGVVARSFAAPAEATWCARDSLLEILAVRADTGVGLVLVVQDSLRPGQHPVVSAALKVTWRPVALASIRWVNDSGVRGFEGNAGSVTVTEAGPAGVAGTLDVRLKHLDTSDTVRMTGRFHAAAITPADSICGRPRQGTIQ